MEWAEENHENPQGSRCSGQDSSWTHPEPTCWILCVTGMFIHFEIMKYITFTKFTISKHSTAT